MNVVLIMRFIKLFLTLFNNIMNSLGRWHIDLSIKLSDYLVLSFISIYIWVFWNSCLYMEPGFAVCWLAFNIKYKNHIQTEMILAEPPISPWNHLPQHMGLHQASLHCLPITLIDLLHLWPQCTHIHIHGKCVKFRNPLYEQIYFWVFC